MPQNSSPAVMAQRVEVADSLDYFPTPPWATRALIEHAIGADAVKDMSCLEPACGEGHMARPLAEYFEEVKASDVDDYGGNTLYDFLSGTDRRVFDWVITNPPFNRASEFIGEGLRRARVGVAVLVRTTFLEGQARYAGLFRDNPPSTTAVFTERVPMHKGRLSRKASTATSYSWLIWQVQASAGRQPVLQWIPPCRSSLERHGDYPEDAPLLL